MYNNPIVPASIGQDRQYQNPSTAYDAAHGTYADHMPAMPVESRLPTQQMPMAPAPSPFIIKSSPGGA